MFGKWKNIKEKIEQSAEFKDIKNSSYRDFVGGGILNKSFVKKQWGVIVLLVILSFFYIGNRYYCEHQLEEIDRLQQKLTEAKYTYLTKSRDLMTMSRQSEVTKIINRKGINLVESTVPPTNVK